MSAIRPFDGPQGRAHLATIEYNDGEAPLEETLLWECEPGTNLLEPTALPDIHAGPPMDRRDFDALVRACRWSARLPYIDPDGTGPLERLPVTAPFHGAIQVEDFQLVPMLKALQMPRVSLLLADDVGLGKTIEAGLILVELILRRRIRRVLILTPASLRTQWRDEMWDKFSLPFDVVDRDATLRLRRQVGMDANPWRSHSRIIASYHYLKQPDVLEEFRAACRAESDDANLPWDLLIVDEAHNLTPVPFGEESDLCAMLREVAPMFEHRLFLTATPHNGHTRSFTGLLEMLDPVRFSQTDELRPAERLRVQDVLVRRLKREINACSQPPRFAERLPPQALTLHLRAGEKTLSEAFATLRSGIRELIAKQGRSKRLAGNFAIEILGKRLLSCPVAFADSWLRCRMGFSEIDDATDTEVIAAQRAVKEETSDDREAESRQGAASLVVGAWLKPFASNLSSEFALISSALETLGLGTSDPIQATPTEDARFDALCDLIRSHLRDASGWLADERIVVFTEYKTTLDYLVRRLRAEFSSDDMRVLCLFGGMDDPERQAVKAAFNDPEDRVRILVATDAASEGLNLQHTARYMLHFDIPWNPARLEQRNGRIDRHGQARDVSIWHFVSTEDRDLAFLATLLRKVDTIREDLGATGELFGEATQRVLVLGDAGGRVELDLSTQLEQVKGKLDVPRDARVTAESPGAAAAASMPVASATRLDHITAEFDLDPEALRQTLDSAMALAVGRPRISDPDEFGRCRIIHPPPGGWVPVIDDTVRQRERSGAPGALRALGFDPRAFVVEVAGRPVFRMRKDTVLLHLGHPLVQRALSLLTRQRFPGGHDSATRWSVRRGNVEPGTDSMIQVTVEELAINDLRETFHHWVRTLRYPVQNGALSPALPHVPAVHLRAGTNVVDPDAIAAARDLWIDVERDVRDALSDEVRKLTALLEAQIKKDHETEQRDATERYRKQQAEVSALIEGATAARFESEIARLRDKARQGVLYDPEDHVERMERSIEAREEELERRRVHFREMRERLAVERDRVLKQILPRRYSLRGDAQVLPISVEIILPEACA